MFESVNVTIEGYRPLWFLPLSERILIVLYLISVAAFGVLLVRRFSFAGPYVSSILFAAWCPLIVCLMITLIRLAELNERISSNDMDESPESLSERWTEVRAPLCLGAATSIILFGSYSLSFLFCRRSRAVREI
jgi:hypothetical protein